MRFSHIVVYRAWASAGGQNGHLPPPGYWAEEPKLSRIHEVCSSISINDLILAMTVYLPVRHLHSRFTVLVSCSGELVVYLCSSGWPNLEADSSVGLYCVTMTYFTSSYNSRRFAACGCLLLNQVERRYLGR